MRFLSVLIVSLFWISQAQAFDTTTQSLVASGFVTSKVTSAPFDKKLILAAQDDAAAFIASDGQLRGAQLESALRFLREELQQSQPKLYVSDVELAEAILVQ
ncbi:DUF2388 domain-containing protein [Pseudomonas sp. NA-150]|uniref:DUF2388 domain-containing protein n=1 Tax=Pseudomonas sp. NA-150 TaxID=3367525 RepID=UPI0037CCBB3A